MMNWSLSGFLIGLIVVVTSASVYLIWKIIDEDIILSGLSDFSILEIPVVETNVIQGSLPLRGPCQRARMLAEGICPNCMTPMETSFTLKNANRLDIGFHCLACGAFTEFKCDHKNI